MSRAYEPMERTRREDVEVGEHLPNVKRPRRMSRQGLGILKTVSQEALRAGHVPLPAIPDVETAVREAEATIASEE